ncbi:MAG: hypothetical protein QW524_01780 [Candidatus Woesearchaeota archaeon]
MNPLKYKELKEFVETYEGSQRVINYNDFLIINLSDDLSFDLIKNIVNETVKSDKTIIIYHSQRELFKIEKYLILLIRNLIENKKEFYTLNIPLCYMQDFPKYSLDLQYFALKGFIREKDLLDLLYFEDCKFCKVRNVCPGAIQKYEDQVFAVFKDFFTIIKDITIKIKIFKSEKKEELIYHLIKLLELNKEIEDSKIFINFADELLIKQLVLYNPKIIYLLSSLPNIENERIKKVTKTRFAHKTLKFQDIEKIIKIPLEFELCDTAIFKLSNNMLDELNEFFISNLKDDEKFRMFLDLCYKIRYILLEIGKEMYLTTSILAIPYYIKELRNFFDFEEFAEKIEFETIKI